MSDPLGNRVKEVLVSEASRKDARGALTRNELAKAIEDLEGERAAQGVRKRHIEARLSEIVHRIRGNKLEPSVYQKLAREQTELKNENQALMTAMADSKQRLHRLRMDIDRHEKEDRILETNRILRKILNELQILTKERKAAIANAERAG